MMLDQVRMTLSERYRETLDGDPRDPAFEVGSGWYAWGEVARVAARIDELLIGAGIGPGQVVGLIGRNRPASSSALIGLIASGRCVAPLNPFQPPQKLAEDAVRLNLAAVIGEHEDFEDDILRRSAAIGGFATIVLETEDAGGVRLVDPLTKTELEPSGRSALLLSTSGTTGTPKRIAIRFDSLDASLADSRAVGIEFGDLDLAGPEQTPLIQHSPMVHIAGALSVARSAYDRRRLVMLPKFSAAAWVSAVERHRPRAVSLPPTMMRAVVHESPPPEALSSIAGVWSGASPIDMKILRTFEDRYGAVVMGSYGATEYAGMIAVGSLEARRRFGHTKDHSVGQLRKNVARVRIVDADGAELPIGEVGVLEVQVHRIGPEWMRTSDLASVDADDFLYFHGRADEAINRGGFKIVPSIIADALRQHPSVGDVAVVALPDERLGEVPVAAVEPKSGGEMPDRDTLMAFVRSQLVAYQVPKDIKVVKALPRTPSFKVDRNAVLALFA
jgi:long-chain acyl-CoA synthetase